MCGCESVTLRPFLLPSFPSSFPLSTAELQLDFRQIWSSSDLWSVLFCNSLTVSKKTGRACDIQCQQCHLISNAFNLHLLGACVCNLLHPVPLLHMKLLACMSWCSAGACCRCCGAPSFAQHLVPCCFCVVGLANVELSHEVYCAHLPR